MTSEFTLRLWAEAQTVKRLRGIAVGMPYLGEARKAEVVDWLLRHNPAAVERARKGQP